MTVIGVARQGGDMGDELAALAAINRRRHAHLDAELIGPVGFPLADAFDLGGMERIDLGATLRSEEHTSELQSLMRISYAVFCLKKKQTYRIRIYKTILTKNTAHVIT